MDIEFVNGNVVATKAAVRENLVYVGELYDGSNGAKWRPLAQITLRLKGTTDPAQVQKFYSDRFIKGGQGNTLDELKFDGEKLYIPYRFIDGYFSGQITMGMETNELSYYMDVLSDLELPLYKEGDAYFGWVVKHPYHYWWYKKV